ncbi:MAG: nitronate monooxygenase [Smithellaceae bacterium]|jgi:enoyl-[acyl-carrier protein] reductase II
MKTRITELFGIKYPILLSGMSWISVPKMVAAVSNAGGLGILATGPLNAEQTRQAIKEIRSLTNKPFGANATLLFPGASENARVLLQEKVPVINFSLGKGDWLVTAAHAYGGKVIATVVNARHAKRAQDYGADGVVATGHEAAAHGEHITSLVLIPSLVDTINIPVIAAGGFADGRGLAAALALGAEGIAMGTRFMTTRESPLHEIYKNLSIEKDVDDTLFSDRFDGILCRVLKTRAAKKAVERGLNLPAAFFNSQEIARQLGLPFSKLFLGVLLSGWKNTRQLAFMANGFKAIKIATEKGDMKKGVLPVGQVTGLIHDEPTVAELMERIVAQAKLQQQKLNNQFS